MQGISVLVLVIFFETLPSDFSDKSETYKSENFAAGLNEERALIEL